MTPSRERPLGVGIVGCGRIARMFHLPVLAASGSARLVALADPDAAALAAAQAAAPEAVGVRDVRALLEVPGVDAVVICLPTHLHAGAAVAALDAGRHVYVEKPLAADLAAAGRVRDAWVRSRRTGAVGFNFRFHPLVRAARAAIDDGALGEIVGIRSVFSSAPRALPDWKRSRSTGGGALLDLASHHVDLVRHLLGCEVDAVSALTRSHRTDADTAALTLALSTGTTAQLLATVSAAASDRVEIFGTGATIEIDRMVRRRITITPAAGPGPGPAQRLAAAARVVEQAGRSTIDRLRPPPEPSFAAALGAFVEQARSGASSTAATIEDGYRSLAVIDAAERSAESGRAVHLDATVAAG